MTSKTLKDENGIINWIVPDELVESGEFKDDDEIKIERFEGRIKITNLTCKRIELSKMQRDLNTIERQLNDDSNPLERVLVIRNGSPVMWLLTISEKLKEAAKRLDEEGF
jgi:hypothetical protein